MSQRPIAIDPELAVEIARFVEDLTEPENPVVTLALIAKHFPCVPLDVALCGFVFRRLLLRGDLQ
jgi:hypothetical protein